MKLKSYFSGTVEGAIEQARKELGDDAMFVNSSPTTPVTRMLGAYEVVFGVPDTAGPRALRAVPAPKPDRLSQDVAELRREIERLSHSLRGGRTPAPGESAVYTELLAREFDPALAQAVADGTPLEELFETDPTLGRPGLKRGVVALVGPPGAGKTTTLVKLAARYGLASRKPAQILTADVYRIAAADQLRSLAGILGIGFEVVETPLALSQALEEHRAKDLIFIDTPGLARGEMEDATDLAAFLAAHPEIDTHLVIPASMKPADLSRVIEEYQVFEPRKLLFTRIDETDRYGALVSEAAQRSLPVSFVTTGQQIPDDLEPATKSRLADLALGNSLTVGNALRPAEKQRSVGASA